MNEHDLWVSVQIDRFDSVTLEYIPTKYEMHTNRGLFSPIKVGTVFYMFGGWNGTESINACERYLSGTMYYASGY